jgi:hypothetical protein
MTRAYWQPSWKNRRHLDRFGTLRPAASEQIEAELRLPLRRYDAAPAAPDVERSHQEPRRHHLQSCYPDAGGDKGDADAICFV